MTTTAYGLRTNPDGFSFLLQPSGEQNLVVEGLPSGLTPKFPPRFCPHDINLNDWVEPPAWTEDPLIQAFLPTPGAGAFIIRNEDRRFDAMLRQLPRLSGADVSMLRPLWVTYGTNLPAIYEGTNLGPVVWITTNLDQAHAGIRHIELAQLYQRRVVFIAYGPFPPYPHLSLITTDPWELDTEPLEQIGAGALRKIINGQNTPLHRAPGSERGLGAA